MTASSHSTPPASVAETPREILQAMLEHLGYTFEIAEENRDGMMVLHVRTPAAARLIGRNGEALEDLQYLFNLLLLQKEESASRIIIDVDGYRLRERDELLDHVAEYAEEVRETGKPVQLFEMNAFERRLVHNAYKDDPDLQTISPPGDDRLKQMTLAPRKAS